MKGQFLKALWGPGGMRLLAGDLVLVVLLAGAAWALLPLAVPGDGTPLFARVEVSGRPSLRLAVSENTVREVSGPLGRTSIEVRDDRVRVLSSPCPLKLCVKTGWIGSSGQMIVCLPNEVVIRLPGSLPGGIDAVSQ